MAHRVMVAIAIGLMLMVASALIVVSVMCGSVAWTMVSMALYTEAIFLFGAIYAECHLKRLSDEKQKYLENDIDKSE